MENLQMDDMATTASRDQQRDLSVSGTLEFMRLLWGIDHALQSTSKRMEQTAGITGPQRLVIRIVGQFPDASAGEIARVLNIHPSTLTGVLRRLEARQMLERKPDPTDGRRALFRLTAQGRQVDEVQEGTPEQAVARALAVCSAGDVEGTRRVLEGITRALEQILAARPS